MRFSLLALLAGSAVAQLDINMAANWVDRSPVDSFQVSEYPIAKQGILDNIGGGSKSRGANKGVVIAAPSDEPDYVYTWTRDSALTFKVLVDLYVTGRDDSLGQGIQDWIASQQKLQQVENPSGTVDTGGLGEPKFHINETAFTGAWGRPQPDGPPLRAVTMITFANHQLKTGNRAYVESIWPSIKLDLDYTTKLWNTTGYDLWEEVLGSSFFSLAAGHRALRQGAAFAKTLGQHDLAKTYTTQATNILCFLQSFWSPEKSAIISNINGGEYRSGLDGNSILTSVHQFDPEAGCEADTFQPCSDRALRNHKTVVDSFRGVYAINANVSGGAVAIGRYAEDVFQGGNPWYLVTFAAAEQLYYATYQWVRHGKIPITSTSLPFFQQVYPSARVGTHSVWSSQGIGILRAVRKYADGFVEVNQKYVGAGGALSEQFDRATGAPKSAPDLTWSYASALTAFDARMWRVPGSWGAKGLKAPGGECAGQPIPRVPTTFNVVSDSPNVYLVGQLTELGVWEPAKAILMNGTRPNWSVTVDLPASRVFEYKYLRKNEVVTWEPDPNRRASTGASGTVVLNDTWKGESYNKVPVTFNLVSHFANAYVVGGDTALGDWDPAKAVAMNGSNPNWTATVEIPASKAFEFKFIRRNADGSVWWQPDPNGNATAPATIDAVWPGDAKVPVTFNLVANASSAYVVGQPHELGEWDPAKAIMMNGSSPNWTATIELPVSSFEFKFLRRNGGEIEWEADPNRRGSTESGTISGECQSAPVAARRPLPTATTPFGTTHSPSSPPPDSHPRPEPAPRQPGRFGVAVGVPPEERAARRLAAHRPLSTAHDIEDDWSADGRWVFGAVARGSRPNVRRGVRGRGMRRGRGQFRSSPADQEPMLPYVQPYYYPMWYPPYPPPMAAPPPVPLTVLPYMLDPLRYYVLGQIEYYFSVQNMCQDLYLRQQMDTHGWIPIATVCSFNRLRTLTHDPLLVRDVMLLSSLVEVSPDGEKARMANGVWTTFVLPDAPQEKSALGLVGVHPS